MTSATKTTAQLVLASGSRAGLVAAIHPGYYMIGRFKECQIRPKSRSVSRRHCLLHWQDDHFRVFDLDSTSGTKINGEKIAPRNWVDLSDGDELKLGKISFSVSIATVSASSSSDVDPQNGAADSSATAATPAERNQPESLLRGKAWQEVDVAAFLESEDDADRERRYDTIRSRHQSRSGDSGILDDDDDIDLGSDSDLHDGSDVRLATARSSPDLLASELDTGATLPDAVSPSTPDVSTPAKLSPKRLPAEHRRRKSAGSTFDYDRLKIVAAAVVAVVVIGFAIVQAVQLLSTPAVPIVTGID